MAVATAVMPATTTTSIPVGGAGRSARRKQRCWIFRVDGITSDVSEVDLLASVRERYTTVKRLVVRSASPPGGLAVGEHQHQHPAVDRNVLVEVQFTGPQPSEGPGALLCDLLCGSSVEAKPVELPRGRKKRARTDAASSEASDSDVEDGGSRKMGGHRSTNSLQQVGEEEEEESPGGGRCITAKPIFSGQGGSPMNRVKDDPGAVRRTSGRDSGGPVAPSSGLAPLSSIGLFKTSVSSAAQKPPSVSCVVVPADTRSMPDLMPPHQLRVVSLDAAQQQTQQQPQQQQQQNLLAMHQGQQQQQQQGKVSPAGVAQWDDVVGRMTTPQNSSHSLDMGPVDLSNSSGAPHQAVKTEFDPLLGASANSGDTWGSNDGQTPLFGPMPPPQPVQPPLRGWSFDSSHTEDNPGSGDFTGGNMVMDLSDVDNLFRSTEPEGKPASGEGGSHVSAGSAGSSADAGAGSRQEQGGVGGVGGVRASAQSHKWTSEGMLPMEKVAIEPSRKECDFEGRPVPTSNAAHAASPPPTVAASPEGQCHLAFTGLDKTGHDLRSLRVTAHFGVDSVHKVGKVTGPIKIGANGRAYAALFYPSMQEIWPELYSTGNIRVVEVDVVVEIRSDIGEYQYVGPQLKVTYLRTPPAGAEVGETEPLLQGRRIASRAPIPFSSDSPQISYSCVDYSCGDWFSDICHSVFRSGATAHQPLPDDPSDLMNVDS